MNYEALRSLIASREDCAGKTAAEKAALLNAVGTHTRRRPEGKIPLDQLQAFCASIGLVAKLKDIADNKDFAATGTDAEKAAKNQLRSIAISFNTLVLMPSIGNFAVDTYSSMVDACVAAGLLTSDQATALRALADEPISDAQYALGQDVTEFDIQYGG